VEKWVDEVENSKSKKLPIIPIDILVVKYEIGAGICENVARPGSIMWFGFTSSSALRTLHNRDA
jgi:hypothetical protein